MVLLLWSVTLMEKYFLRRLLPPTASVLILIFLKRALSRLCLSGLVGFPVFPVMISLDGEERGGDEFLVVSGNKVVIVLV